MEGRQAGRKEEGRQAGRKQRCKEGRDIEEGSDVLLEASHEEHKVRSRVRVAATLDGALDSLLEFENLSEDESQSEFNSDEFEDCQFFVMSDGENEGCERSGQGESD